MKNNTAATIINLALIALAAFLCWHFNTGFGCLVLIFMCTTHMELKANTSKNMEGEEHKGGECNE